MIASPEEVHTAETFDFSSIKPYVKAISMEPSKYSWSMMEDLFQHIVSVPRIEKIFHGLNKKRNGVLNAGEDYSSLPMSRREELEKLGWKNFVQKHTDGKLPFSDTELAASFERYKQHAQRTHEMFETKRIHHAWTRVFTQLSEAHSFRIGVWEPDGDKVDCEIGSDHHQHNILSHDAAVCQRWHEPVGEALFRAAIASLTAARSKVMQLEIECIFDGKYDWADDGTLDELDLSSLHTLSFSPVEVEFQEMREWPSECEATVIARCSLALTTLLRKCSPNLRKLLLFPGDFRAHYLDWPLVDDAAPASLPILSALESFTTSLGLRLTAFGQFLLQCPALTFLQLDGCEGDEGEWRDLFDAVRNHPNRMTVEFDQLPCNVYTTCSVSHYTGEASKTEFYQDPFSNIGYSLENYLSGRRHWDRTLRMWFENGDGEPSNSDDDGGRVDDESDPDEE